MPEYTLLMKIPNAGNKEYSYGVHLTDCYEDYPEDYFRIEQNRSHLCQTLQHQSGRTINNAQLKKLLEDWIGEIKLGRRRTTISLDLPPDGFAPPVAAAVTATPAPPPLPKKPQVSFDTLGDNTPPTVIQPKPKPPAVKFQSGTMPQDSTRATPEKPEEEPTVSVEAATNQADF